MSTPTMTASEAVLRRLEFRMFRKLDGLLHGDYLGLVPGPGSESGEGRPYLPGDEVRRIDWNLTARTAVPHVRNTVAERELETWIVFDRSRSLDFGTARCEKREVAVALACAFGFLTGRTGNRLGAVTFGDGGLAAVSPRGGRDALYALVRRLHTSPSPGRSNASLSDALRHTARVARRRGLVVVVSDFLDRDDWPRALRMVAARHDVVVCHVTDPRDAELPCVGLLTLVDPETGRRIEVQSANRRIRERFAAAAAAQRQVTRDVARAARAGYLEVGTERDWMLDVVRYVARRRRTR